MRLAVIIPVYNRRELVQETLASVREQTVMPSQVVVVDDGSTDGSAETIETWLAVHPMACDVRVIRQANAGVSAARNRGATEAAGADLLAFLDSDDLWPPDFVEKAVATFAVAPKWVGASADSLIRRHDGQGRVVSETLKPWRGAGLRATKAIHRAFPGTPATVVRMEVFNRLRGFPLGLQLGEDAVFFLLASAAGSWGRIACGPVVYRYFESTTGGGGHLSSIRSPDVFVQFALELDARAEAFQCIPQLRSAITHRWRRAGKGMKDAGRLAEARACYARALVRDAWDLKARWRMFCL